MHSSDNMSCIKVRGICSSTHCSKEYTDILVNCLEITQPFHNNDILLDIKHRIRIIEPLLYSAAHQLPPENMHILRKNSNKCLILESANHQTVHMLHSFILSLNQTWRQYSLNWPNKIILSGASCWCGYPKKHSYNVLWTFWIVMNTFWPEKCCPNIPALDRQHIKGSVQCIHWWCTHCKSK